MEGELINPNNGHMPFRETEDVLRIINAGVGLSNEQKDSSGISLLEKRVVVPQITINKSRWLVPILSEIRTVRGQLQVPTTIEPHMIENSRVEKSETYLEALYDSYRRSGYGYNVSFEQFMDVWNTYSMEVDPRQAGVTTINSKIPELVLSRLRKHTEREDGVAVSIHVDIKRAHLRTLVGPGTHIDVETALTSLLLLAHGAADLLKVCVVADFALNDKTASIEQYVFGPMVYVRPEEADSILMPIEDNGAWSLVTLAMPDNDAIIASLYSSVWRRASNHLPAIEEWLNGQKLLLERMTGEEIDMPTEIVQCPSEPCLADSGVFMLLNTIAVLTGKDPDTLYSGGDQGLREWLACCLMEGKVPKGFKF